MKKTRSDKEKTLLSGNEALALAAFEAGVKVASAYPGTPSTEILENLSLYEGVYTEWAPNEKVAFEVALGASFAGVRALATMKHVGLNVAADPLFTAAYTGVRGGLVIIVADDPDMHSSQNEQDSRNYAFAAKVPMLEPSDAAEAKEFLKSAYRISEEFDTPVLLKSSTRMSHVKGVVTADGAETSSVTPGIEKMPEKFVMLPANARKRRIELAARMQRLQGFSETFGGNRIEWGDRKRGFITSGVSYLYVKEVVPEASVLKLGMVWPLPEKMIKEFAEKVDEVFIVEELDPFLELHIKAMGIACRGKDLVPAIGELNPTILRQSITGKKAAETFEPVAIPMRPPNLCPGCPHRGIFYAISKLGAFVTGDIGCYTLAALKPLSAMDTCVCMGAGIGNAHGMAKALGKEGLGKIVAVIGDSTFFHSGITGLIDIVFNRGNSTVVILDNRTTGMTGHQPHPASGMTITGDPTVAVDIGALCRAVGVKHVRTVNPHDIVECGKVLKEEIERPEPSVIITKAACVLLPEMKKRKDKKLYVVVSGKCTGCRSCLKLGCPAIEWVPLTGEEAKKRGYKPKQKGYSQINAVLCDGCGQCAPLCKFKAIVVEGEGSDE
ncbi:MAG: indolepyruvate ferredoxin oxidoreductase subunit alpha [Nitrospiraceae bacterium]|nr:indolepyruvate ferredoxin oxidoreductase subunit alpha [Nitrospiraceae bacterium]